MTKEHGGNRLVFAFAGDCNTVGRNSLQLPGEPNSNARALRVSRRDVAVANRSRMILDCSAENSNRPRSAAFSSAESQWLRMIPEME